MNAESYKTRGLNYALLFGPPKHFSRSDATRVYDKVCEATGLDDFQFKYGSSSAESVPKGMAPPFAIMLFRREGRGGVKVTVDTVAGQPALRLLIENNVPHPTKFHEDRCDQTQKAVFDALPGGWQRVHVEVKINGECDARASGGATKYLIGETLSIHPDWIGSFERPANFAGICLEFPPGRPDSGDALSNPRELIKIETLRENPEIVYVEYLSAWPQFPRSAAQGIDISTLRQFSGQPSEYIRAATDRLDELVKTFRMKG